MSMSNTVEVLRELAERAQDGEPDLSAAVGVVADIGRALSAAPEPDLRPLQSAIAAVREKLEYSPGNVEQRPVDALKSEKAPFFLAGALWAANEIMTSELSDRHQRAARLQGQSDRASLRQLALELLDQQPVVTPSDITRHAARLGAAARPDQVSKALSDLLAEGSAVPTTAPAGADRRSRHYAKPVSPSHA